MADFIKLTEVIYQADYFPGRKEVERVFNKNLITGMNENRANTQTFIIYNGEELIVKETIDEINELCSQE